MKSVVKTILSQVSFREKLLIVGDIVLTKLRGAIPREYRVLRLLLRDLAVSGVEMKKKGGANLIRMRDTARGVSYYFRLRRGTSDAAVARQVFLDAEYEPLLHMIAERSSTGSIRTIVDAGANVGYTTIFLRSRLPEAECYLIEPDAGNFRALGENLKLNGYEKVHPVQAALWGQNEGLTLCRDFRDGADWSVRVRRANGAASAGEVRGLTFPQIMQEAKLEQVDVLKIDIEGAEVDVFASAAHPELFLSKVRFLAMELHEETGQIDSILQVLAANQFEMTLIGQTYFGFNRRFFPAAAPV